MATQTVQEPLITPIDSPDTPEWQGARDIIVANRRLANYALDVFGAAEEDRQELSHEDLEQVKSLLSEIANNGWQVPRVRGKFTPTNSQE